MISARAILLFIAIIAGATAAYANVPIIVETGAGRRAVMKLCSDASDQLRNGDIAGAKRNVDAALRIDPRLWPALYDRAQIFRRQDKYELAIQDCIMAWKDEDMIDTLAAAYAETGDFDQLSAM
jgi:Tfp pilus assembly protein PilF